MEEKTGFELIAESLINPKSQDAVWDSEYLQIQREFENFNKESLKQRNIYGNFDSWLKVKTLIQLRKITSQLDQRK